jgi:hypothetical protein
MSHNTNAPAHLVAVEWYDDGDHGVLKAGLQPQEHDPPEHRPTTPYHLCRPDAHAQTQLFGTSSVAAVTQQVIGCASQQGYRQYLQDSPLVMHKSCMQHRIIIILLRPSQAAIDSTCRFCGRSKKLAQSARPVIWNPAPACCRPSGTAVGMALRQEKEDEGGVEGQE